MLILPHPRGYIQEISVIKRCFPLYYVQYSDIVHIWVSVDMLTIESQEIIVFWEIETYKESFIEGYE